MTTPNPAMIAMFRCALAANAVYIKQNGIDVIDYALLESIKTYCNHYHTDTSGGDLDDALGRIAPIVDTIDCDDLWWASKDTIASMLGDLNNWLCEIESLLS